MTCQTCICAVIEVPVMWLLLTPLQQTNGLSHMPVGSSSRHSITRWLTGSFLCKDALNTCCFAYGDTKGRFTKSLRPWGVYQLLKRAVKIDSKASQYSKLQAMPGRGYVGISFNKNRAKRLMVTSHVSPALILSQEKHSRVKLITCNEWNGINATGPESGVVRGAYNQASDWIKVLADTANDQFESNLDARRSSSESTLSWKLSWSLLEITISSPWEVRFSWSRFCCLYQVRDSSFCSYLMKCLCR